MKILKIGVGVIVVLGLLLSIGFYWFFKSAVPDYRGTERLQGLKAKVEVRSGQYGIPHIFAENETDLYFAQGYIMARERLFQMDVTRLAGRGELSTLFGDRTVDKDRFLKTVGFYRKAKSSNPLLSRETRDVLQAFAKGVNHYIKTADPLPREYFILGAKPDLWQEEDSVVVAMMMSYSLTRSKKVDLVMHRIREKVGDSFMKAIIPRYPPFAPTLTEKTVTRNINAADTTQRTASAADTGPIGFGNTFPLPLDIAASNWMTFSGKMTDTGKAMFAGSPDLAPTLPGLFYVMHIKGGDVDAMGGVLPGVPSLGPLGYNGYLAFSAVNGRGDELDYFIEKPNPDNPNQYLTENGYRDFRILKDTIRIKTSDGFKTEELEIRISRHGPIISGVMPGAPANCAMQWAALELPNHDITGLLKLVKARNFTEFREAVSHVRTINLNIGYADRDGNIGWQFVAAPPIRKKGEGSFPVPGWTGEYDWQGYIPFEELPYDLNPAPGYVGSFNNEPGNAPYFMTNYYLFERALSFQHIMQNRPKRKVSFKELKEMQLDTGSMVARRWVPLVLPICSKTKQLRTCNRLFKDWDFKMDQGSSAATLFNYFYSQLMKNTLVDEVGEKIWQEDLGREYIYYVPDLLLTRIHNQPYHPVFDDVRTGTVKETRDDIIRKSMIVSIAFLEKTFGTDPDDWQWGKVHQMVFKHPLGGTLSFLNLDPIPTHGSPHTINAGFWDLKNPFNFSSGGVIRMMVDFANPEGSTIVSPPGQSGHYLSPYYDNLARIWADGNQVPMHFLSGKELPNQLTLLPAK